MVVMGVAGDELGWVVLAMANARNTLPINTAPRTRQHSSAVYLSDIVGFAGSRSSAAAYKVIDCDERGQRRHGKNDA